MPLIENLLEAIKGVARAYGFRLMPSCRGKIEIKGSRKPATDKLEALTFLRNLIDEEIKIVQR